MEDREQKEDPGEELGAELRRRATSRDERKSVRLTQQALHEAERALARRRLEIERDQYYGVKRVEVIKADKP